MGIVIAVTIILLWAGHLVYALTTAEVDPASPVFYAHILLQAYLYTGLFITGHDAMHGAVGKKALVNKFTGTLATFLFAGLSYKKLIKNHALHHKYPGTEKDPDFNPGSQNFFVWWAVFLYRYTTIMQLIIMGIAYNLLAFYVSEAALWSFWIIPALLATFQLFFFGTWLPHRRPHKDSMKPHNSRTQKPNHLWAMLSCYFFGYHFEHHEKPYVPWWQLYKEKSRNAA